VEDTTLVTFLLDRSGSMDACKAATIEGFNAYLATLRQATTPILFTLLQFDSQSLDKVCFEQVPAAVADLTNQSFVPRGGTPLIESCMKTIRAIAGKAVKPKVVVNFQTDGEENASGPEYTWDALKALIAEKTAQGWQFNFLGAGVDAYAHAQNAGVAAMAAMSYDHTNPHATRAAFADSALNATMFASGRSKNTEYSMQQRRASGDMHADRVFAGNTGAQPVNLGTSEQNLDLSGPAPPSTARVTPPGLDLTQ